MLNISIWYKTENNALFSQAGLSTYLELYINLILTDYDQWKPDPP